MPACDFPGAIKLEILDREGKSIPTEELQKIVAVDFQKEKSPGNTESLRYEIKNLTEGSQFFQIRCSVSFDPDKMTVYDGLANFDVTKYTGTRLSTDELYRIPVIAAWNARNGFGIAAGANDFHSRVLPLITKNPDNSVTLASVVFAALMKKDSVYHGKFILISFWYPLEFESIMPY